MAVTAYPVWPLRRRHDALLDIVENQIARQEGGIAVKDVLYHLERPTGEIGGRFHNEP